MLCIEVLLSILDGEQIHVPVVKDTKEIIFLFDDPVATFQTLNLSMTKRNKYGLEGRKAIFLTTRVR